MIDMARRTNSRNPRAIAIANPVSIAIEKAAGAVEVRQELRSLRRTRFTALFVLFVLFARGSSDRRPECSTRS